MWWIIYFGIYLLLSLFSLFTILQYAPLTFGDFLSIFLTVILVTALFSFVFRKSILSQKIWTYLFWIAIIFFIESMLEILLPPEIVDTYLSFLKSSLPTIPIVVIVNWILAVPAVFTLYKLSKGKQRSEAKTSAKTHIAIILLLVLGLIILIIGILPGGFISKALIRNVPKYTSSIPVDQWTVYKSVDPAFSLSYPPDWSYEQSTGLQRSILVLTFIPKDRDYAKASSIILRVLDRKDAVSLQNWTAKYTTPNQRDEQSASEDFILDGITNMNNTTVGGKEAITFNFDNPYTESAPGVLVMSNKYVFAFVNIVKGNSEDVRDKMVESLTTE